MTREGLTAADFRRVNLQGEDYFLVAECGEFEITLEPHLVAGYSIGIYYRGGNIALEKRGFWKKNHPEASLPATTTQEVMERSIEYANQLYDKYVRQAL